MFYPVKTPWWLKKLYGQCIWNMPADEKLIYLTFDDGPHPTITPFVLDQLRAYGARATFFCIGKNVVAHRDVYERILLEGHKTGNHTFNHLNGWKTSDKEYFDNISEAKKFIDSELFRPPYGKATRFQLRQLANSALKFRIIMWDVLSGDFDTTITPEKCALNVVRYSKAGSIIVFHDSEKAFSRLQVALPKMLKYFSEKGYKFEAID